MAKTFSASWAEGAAVSGEGLRPLVYAGVAASAVLPRGLPGGSRALAAVGSAAALSPDGAGASLSLRAESPSPRASAGAPA